MTERGIISYEPSEGLCYDPSDDHYWSASALDAELTRAFELCHGCRMCFKFCDSFPTLFSLIDDKYDGDVRGVDAAETASVMDACFQCKLCETECPYTPAKGHRFELDFPKLVHRYKAQRHRNEGSSIGREILADPDSAGRFARMSFGLANAMNRVSAHRFFMEKFLGVHREKLLPDFASQTFESWAAAAGHMAAERRPEAVLFQTCYVQSNEPSIGRDTMEVLFANQVDVACVEGLVCCGMPAWEHGDLHTVQARARTNLDILMPYVEAGAKVLAINPTCSMMLRMDYPELLDGPDRERASRLAQAVMDPCEYLWSIRKEPRFNLDFKTTPGGKLAYHAPCHLRAQRVGFRGRDLLRKIPGIEVHNVLECCGHDGTYAMTVEGFEPSQRIGKKSFDGMHASGTEIWATDCPLAAKQFEQHARIKPMHPMSILARAYREDGFPRAVRRAPEAQ